jgi:hypothetical protein
MASHGTVEQFQAFACPPLATKRNSFLCTLRWRLALSIKKIRGLADLLPLKSAMSLITVYPKIYIAGLFLPRARGSERGGAKAAG